MTATVRALSYSRCSTPDQTTETQTDRLRALASQMNLELPDERVFVDDAVTGRTMDRPQFERVRELVRSRAVDVVLTTKLDRLGRSARGVLEFFDLAESSGVRVVCADQAIDTATPLGRFTRTIAAAFAELEADMIRDRTVERMRAITEEHRKTGKWNTRSGRAVGRPARVDTTLLEQIRRLRDGEKLRWAQIALRVHAPATSCRKWYSSAKQAAPTRAGGTGT